MSYTIKYSNGKILATVADQTYDNVSTSLTIVGKNSNAYGESINQNFVRLLENFANTLEPRSPVTGQLWYNTALGRMYVYNTSSFRPVGGTIIAAKQPTGLVPGDLWIDTTNQQLWWFDGTKITSTGKNYSDVTGKAGWVTETVLDSTLINQTVSSLYNNGSLIAVLSEKDINLFTEYCGTTFLSAGITLNPTIEDVRFNGTATYALGIAGFMPENFLQNNVDGYTTGTIHFLNDEMSATFGSNDNLQVYMNGSIPSILGAIPDAKLDIKVVNSDIGEVSLITLDGASKRVGINNINPLYQLDVKGDVRINGNLLISGSQTAIETSVLQVKDFNIELGTGQTTPSDSAVNGGGITLHGTTDHNITYASGLGGGAWSFTENVNLNNGKSFYINGALVLDSTRIYSSSAPGLIDLGNQPLPSGGNGPYVNSIQFNGMTLTTNTIRTLPGTDLVLRPASTNVDFTGSQIINLGPPIVETNAATKKYVDDEFNLRGVSTRRAQLLTLDVTHFVNVNAEILDYINKVLPIDGGILLSQYAQPIGSICVVNAITYSPSTSTFTLSLDKTLLAALTSPTTTATFVSDVAGTVQVTTPLPVASYQPKLFEVQPDLGNPLAGVWVFIQDIT